jgi:hypothetical protein
MFFVVMSGGRKTATAAAVVLVLCLLVSLCYSPNKTMIILVIFYSLATSTVIMIEWYLYTPLIHYVMLYFGVFMSFISVTDIWEHTVVRASPDSDAYALYEDYNGCPCCFPRCVGFTWLISALLFQASAFILDYMLLSEECEDKGWFECIFDTRVDFHDWQWDGDLFT